MSSWRREIRILVVDDDEIWRSGAQEMLADFTTNVAEADSFDGALELLSRDQFDAALLDLKLEEYPAHPLLGKNLDKLLLEKLRQESANPSCAFILYTGYPPGKVLNLQNESLVHGTIFKQEMSDEDFAEEGLLEIIRRGILRARLYGAADRDGNRAHFTLRFDDKYLRSVEVRGPAPKGPIPVDGPVAFKWSDFARRSERINLDLLRREAVDWRADVDGIGDQLLELIDKSPFGKQLARAGERVTSSDDLQLSFEGPIGGLSVPFELMRDEHDYLCLRHVVIRRAVIEGHASQKEETFSSFIGRLAQSTAPSLRVLIVAADAARDLPAVIEEAERLEEEMTSDLERIGIRPAVTVLKGPDATRGRVIEEISNGGHHIFHFAGHGRNQDHRKALPELDGLLLAPDQDGREFLTANDLRRTAQVPTLQLVFLSSCLGARTASQLQAGDLHGVYDALFRADVPTVIGHRWLVWDDSSSMFASAFYSHLWRTFSPGEAVLQARRDCNREAEEGANDPVWASPVLLMQG